MTRPAPLLAVVGLAAVLLAGCGTKDASTAGSPVAPGTTSAGTAGSSAASAPSAVPAAAVPACPRPTGSGSVSGGLPQLSLPCLDGSGDVDLAALRGPLVVNVWASWCPPCRAELPALAEVARSAGDRVRFLGVDVVDDATAATALMEQLKVPYPSVFDVQGSTRGPLRWVGPPVTYFVAADGRIAGVHRGQVSTAAELRGLIEKYLGVTQ